MLNTLQIRIHQHQFLSTLRNKLLHLHKVLLDMEQITYEQVRGKVSRGELLQLVIDHDQFAWLHQISERIVQIDEMLRADEPLTLDKMMAIARDVQALLTPDDQGDDFAVKYYAAFQHNPDVVLAHADVVKLLVEPV